MSELSNRVLDYLAAKNKSRTVSMMVEALKVSTPDMNVAVSHLRDTGKISSTKLGRANAYKSLKWAQQESRVAPTFKPLRYGLTANGMRDGSNDYKQWASRGGD